MGASREKLKQKRKPRLVHRAIFSEHTKSANMITRKHELNLAQMLWGRSVWKYCCPRELTGLLIILQRQLLRQTRRCTCTYCLITARYADSPKEEGITLTRGTGHHCSANESSDFPTLYLKARRLQMEVVHSRTYVTRDSRT